MDSRYEYGEDVMEKIRNAEADLIVLQNITFDGLRQLEYAVAPFRVIYTDVREDVPGSVVLFRVAIRSPLYFKEARNIYLDGVADPQSPQAIAIRLQWHGRMVTVLSIQGVSPLSSHRQYTQDRQFRDLAHWVNQQSEPLVVMGNFNCTPWSYRFRRLLKETGLHNSQLGFGVQGTWPATGGAMGQLPLDHCLLSPSLMAMDRRLGPPMTSSHHSLLVNVQWAGGASLIKPPDYNPDYEYIPTDIPPRPRRGMGRRRRMAEQQAQTQPAQTQPFQTQPATRPTTRPAAGPTTRPAAGPTTRPASKPAAAPAPRPTSQPAAKPATTRPASAPATRPATKPASTQPASTQPASTQPAP